jgi:hypothetical protein
MLRNLKELRGYAIRATDGVIGKVNDFYFDDEAWGIGYLVVDTDSRLSGRKVLISPIALASPDWMIHRNGATPLRDDCHLRSGNAVLGHHIEATDGDIGHLEDWLSKTRRQTTRRHNSIANANRKCTSTRRSDVFCSIRWSNTQDGRRVA